MKVLWAPWRMSFIAAKKERGCIFCKMPRNPDRRESLVLSVTTRSVVMMNKYPYNNGHLMVAPRKHTADLGRLTAGELQDLSETLRRTVGIIQEELRPDGVNVGLNLGPAAGAGIVDHLHWHIVPRWHGDTNFMPVVGEVKVMPQHLLDGFDRLCPRFATRRGSGRGRKEGRVAAGGRRR